MICYPDLCGARLDPFRATAHANARADNQMTNSGDNMQVMNGVPADELGDGPQWRKSTASNPSGNCVEMAALDDGAVAVRNSRHPAGPALVYTRAEVAAFLIGVKNGEFDDLA